MQVINIYDHNKKHIGVARKIKKNGTVEIKFNEDNYYADVILELDEYKEYMKIRGFLEEWELGQLDIFNM